MFILLLTEANMTYIYSVSFIKISWHSLNLDTKSKFDNYSEKIEKGNHLGGR